MPYTTQNTSTVDQSMETGQIRRQTTTITQGGVDIGAQQSSALCGLIFGLLIPIQVWGYCSFIHCYVLMHACSTPSTSFNPVALGRARIFHLRCIKVLTVLKFSLHFTSV